MEPLNTPEAEYDLLFVEANIFDPDDLPIHQEDDEEIDHLIDECRTLTIRHHFQIDG